jgi:TadE-like protein
VTAVPPTPPLRLTPPADPLSRLLNQAAGQATVELIALLPLLVTLTLGLFTFLAADRAHEQAAEAAQAGARALLNDRDPKEAACTTLGRSPSCRHGVSVSGRAVTVTMRPKGPFPRLNRSLQAVETAKAGP